MKQHSYLLLFVLLTFLYTTKGLAQGKGKSFLQNYVQKEYKGHAQNWAMIQDKRGIIYIANGNGVMEYDGNNWNITKLPGDATARSLAVNDDGVLFVGTSTSFGYMSVDEQGNSYYKRLDTLLPDSLQDKITDVWTTHILDDVVYFRCYRTLYVYDHGKIKVINSEPGRVFFSNFLFKDYYYLYEGSTSDGRDFTIWKVNATEKTAVPDNEKFLGRSTAIMFPYKKDTILLGGRRGGFYKYPFSENPDQDTTLFKSINTTLRRRTAYGDPVKINDGYAIGSLGHGLLLFDDNYQFIQVIDKETNGLNDNIVYALAADRDGAAWTGLSNGIARVDLASEVSYWNHDSGIEGTLSWVERFKGKLYVASSNASFVMDGNRVTKINRTAGRQCWHLLKFTNPDDPEDQRLLMSTAAIWELRDEEAVPVLNVPNLSTVFKMYQDKHNPYRVWLGMTDGVGSMILKKDEKNDTYRWEFEGVIEGSKDNCRSIAQDNDGDIWIGTFRNGVIRLKKKSGEREFEVVKYAEDEGLLSTVNTIIFEAHGDIIFGTGKGLCWYDPETNRFVPYEKFGKQYADGSLDVFSMQEDANGDVWMCGLFNNESPAVVAERQTGNVYNINTNPFKKVPPMMALAMTIEPDGTAWLGGSEGLFRYKPNPNLSKKDAAYAALIRKVTIGKDSTIFGGNYAKKVTAGNYLIPSLMADNATTPPFIDASNNSINFYFASLFYDNESQTRYKFYLEGFDTEWSEWSNKKEKEYTNLPGGDYVFHVKAKNLYGNESTEGVYAFTVGSPWYLQWWAYLLYILIAGFIIFSAVKWNARRLEKENERLEGIIDERTIEVRKQADQLLIKNSELSQQKEEILVQAENLQELNEEISAVNNDLNAKTEALEKAHANVQNLSAIGKTITSTLDIREIIKITYENVNNLMDASGFGVGVYEKSENILSFQGYMEKGKVLEDHYEPISRQNPSIAAQVLMKNEPFFSNDLETDLKERDIEIIQGDVPLSVIYLPLVYNEQKVGVITVQSFEKNSYSDTDFDILQSLASYASIALAHAHGYEIIRSKNKNITDSIRYSETIQNAFLPNEQQLSEALEKYFVLYKPKDIVSGDFYWLSHQPEIGKTFIAAIDCTGHGVPGSFMSIIGATLLNEIVNIKGIHDPATVLEELNQDVIATLSQNATNANDDGMDVCLCLIESQESEIQITYAGAKRDLYYITPQETLQVVAGDRKLIGGRKKTDKTFTNKQLTTPADTVFYLTTDGFVDQHNQERRKFGTLQFKALLQEIASKPLHEQKETLSKVFAMHKGDMAQRDDVTILGFRV